MDIAAAEGTKIVSPSKGKVILVGDFFYAGNYIIIDHGYGLISSYSHLSSVLVDENELIEKGQKIGEVGSTGRSTGPHLDWRINWFSERLDPALFIKK